MDLLSYLTDDLSRAILAELITVLILLLILLNILRSKKLTKSAERGPFEKEDVPEIERKKESEEDDLIAELKKVHSSKKRRTTKSKAKTN